MAMRARILLLLVVALAGCTIRTDNGASTTTTTETRTLLDETVALDPTTQSAEATAEIPQATSSVQISLQTGSAVNLRIDSGPCDPNASSNTQIGVSSSVSFSCGDLPPGPFTFTIRRDAGEGDVRVVVTGRVKSSTAS